MSIQLRPSKAHRWTQCAASPSFESALPEQVPNDEAREGTCAAWVAECVLKGDAGECADLIDRNHSNGWLVTPDMAFFVQQYVDLIRSRGGLATAELYVSLTALIAGTLDSATMVDGPILYVDDLKYGYKIHDPFGHFQLLIYAGALLKMLLEAGRGQHITHVQLGIFQPRAFHPDGPYRTWTITVDELWQWCNWIIARGDECQKPNPVATPGPQCGECAAATSCAALAMTNYAAFSYVQDHRQRKMTGPEAAQEWRFLDAAKKLIDARRKALEAEIIERYKTEYFPGIKMEPSYGHRKFTADAATVKLFAGVDPTDKVMVTPAELERRGGDPVAIAAMTETPFIGHRLKTLPYNHIAKAFVKG